MEIKGLIIFICVIHFTRATLYAPITARPVSLVPRVSPTNSKASTGVSISSLLGCPDLAYNVKSFVGNQTIELLVDTGSSTTGVAGVNCSSCNTSHYYNPSLSQSSVILGTQVLAEYQDGSQWSGKAVSDSFALMGISIPAFAFGMITAQSNFFATSTCVVGSASTTSLSDGIMGMAYPPLLEPGTQSIMDRFFVDEALQENIFSLYMCFTNHGELTVGGLNTSVVTNTSLIAWAPCLGPSTFFFIGIFAIQVGNTGPMWTVSGLRKGSSMPFIVDSGTTVTILPASLYQSLVLKFTQNPDWPSVFDMTFFLSGECVRMPPTTNETWLNARLPTINFYFDGFMMPLLATRLLLFRIDLVDNSTCYASGIAPSSSNEYILGLSTLTQYLTIFDLDTAYIGFYDDPGPVCRTGLHLTATSDATPSIDYARTVFFIAFAMVCLFAFT